ncbi:MAG TPA: glycosyltransferase family 1 protein [Methanolinea sp.]|nr:glycosyltransferase family 1 protein [Methanolinea sp.]
MIVDYINGRKTQSHYGTAKYSHEISKRFPPGLINRIEYPLPIYSRYIDGFTRRYLYPHIVKIFQKTDHVHHITNQDLAFLLTRMELPRTVITCYDLIPWIYYKNRSPYWRRNIEGLCRADRIITISEFSKDEIIKHTGIPAERIDVVYCGVDRDVFYPKRDKSPLREWGIHENQKVILYVGSEEPRKNLETLVEAIAHVCQEIPDIVLLKVGSPGMGGDRKKTLALVKTHHLEDNVFFTGDVSEYLLAKYYNAADIFVFPSLYEGFGLPIIEAMACGCPVIASNTSSIPEVVGDAAILVNSINPEEIAKAALEILTQEEKRMEVVKKGLSRVSQFDWDAAAKKTIRIYESMGTS